jgi:hypothetical protein
VDHFDVQRSVIGYFFRQGTCAENGESKPDGFTRPRLIRKKRLNVAAWTVSPFARNPVGFHLDALPYVARPYLRQRSAVKNRIASNGRSGSFRFP